VLPFILRRTKANVATDLPSKTIVDILCPLSVVQQEMYVTFQKGLRLSDDRLEKEIIRLKRKTAGDLLDEVSAVSQTKRNTDIRPKDSQFPDLMAAFNQQNTDEMSTNEDGPLALHPLRALLYLKLLCVHPSLAVSSDHTTYRKRLVEDVTSSGKLARLGKLSHNLFHIRPLSCVMKFTC